MKERQKNISGEKYNGVGMRSNLTIQNVWVRVKRTSDSRALSDGRRGRGTVSIGHCDNLWHTVETLTDKTTSIHVRTQMDTGALFATTAARAEEARRRKYPKYVAM